MGQYVLVYSGGSSDMPEPGSDGFNELMAAWGGWFESMGDAVLDGGNPFGAAVSIASDGTQSDGSATGASGYSIIQADSQEKAGTHASGCPHLAGGGAVDVFEAIDM
jgi:hypothetical protein